MSFDGLAVGDQRLVKVSVSDDGAEPFLVPVRAVLTSDHGATPPEDSPRYEWQLNAFGTSEPLRVGAGTEEELYRSCCYLLAQVVSASRALILLQDGDAFGVYIFKAPSNVTVGPAFEEKSDD